MDDRLNSESTLIEELNIRKGTFLTEQHQVVDFLGEGAYGYITKFLRTATSETEAVKISKKKSVVFINWTNKKSPS